MGLAKRMGAGKPVGSGGMVHGGLHRIGLRSYKRSTHNISSQTRRVHVPKHWLLRILVLDVAQVYIKHVIMEYLDP